MRQRRDDLARAGLCATGCGRPRVYRVYCRECNRESAKRYREANRERVNEYARLRWSPTRELHDQRLAEYRAKYPEGKRKRKFEHRPHSILQRRAYSILKSYGLTSDDFALMLERQGGGCAVCGATTSGDPRRPALHVDHDHETGVVRGILCLRCNVSIGLFQDDASLIERAAIYLRDHSARDATQTTPAG